MSESWLWVVARWFCFFSLDSVRKLYQDAVLNVRTDLMSDWYTAVKLCLCAWAFLLTLSACCVKGGWWSIPVPLKISPCFTTCPYSLSSSERGCEVSGGWHHLQHSTVTLYHKPGVTMRASPVDLNSRERAHTRSMSWKYIQECLRL